MLPQLDSARANSAHTNQILELMYRLMEYRHQEIRPRLGKVPSMLHLDVLLLIYHFAKFGTGNILEIGPYIGGSTIAAAIGTRESGRPNKIISIEIGGRLKHPKMPSTNIFKDLKKNLGRFGVLEDVTLINGSSFDPATTSAVRQTLVGREVGLFIFDADDNVRRDLDGYGDLLSNDCWVVIDDYFGPKAKTGPLRAQVDEFVSAGRLLPFGYYGWGTWVGQWQRK